MSNVHNLNDKPTVQETIKRLSSGFSLNSSHHSDHNHADGTSTKDDKSLKIATFSLQTYLKDRDFAVEFLEKDGLQSLCDIILNSSGNTLAYALNSLLSLMEHEIGWDSLDIKFITYIGHIVVNEQLATIARPATAILLKLICATATANNSSHNNSSSTGKDVTAGVTTAAAAVADNNNNNKNCKKIECYGYATVHSVIEKETKLIQTLVDRLMSQEYLLSIISMNLLIAMMKYVTDEYITFLSNEYDKANLRKMILRLMKNHPSQEMKLLILEYQTAFIKNVHRRYNRPVSAQNASFTAMLNEILKASTVAATKATSDVHAAYSQTKGCWKKIGFSSEVPQREFIRTGLLGLEQMHSFITKHKEAFDTLYIDQLHRPDNKKCPFARASIEVTELLCRHWSISENTTIADFQALLLSFDHIHATTLQTYFRIFRDMEATNSDLPKVSALARSQLRAVLNDSTINDITSFDETMFSTPYERIRDRRLKELEWADDLLGRDAISNLRSRLSKESFEFLKNQRIHCLLEGCWFPLIASASHQQRLSVMGGNTINSSILPSGLTPSSLAIHSGVGSSINVAGTHLGNNHHQGSGASGGGGFRRWRYYKLSRSKQYLMYGDFSDKIMPVINTYDSLPNHIDLSEVSEIRTIRTYSNSNSSNTNPLSLPRSSSTLINSNVNSSSSHILGSHVSTSSDTSTETAAQQNRASSFALYSKENNRLLAEFYCSSTSQAAEWKDGFSMLLFNRFTSKETAELFHTLTEVGVKAKLLQIAGDRIEIPHSAPEIPPVPPGLGSNFFYNSVDT
ncbi:ELMO/CED-12 family-domain-containing protein [Mycotypha africana]|uniref:ELMO/CED-12 family-domain-containing protein n=1 Tax=Mycotypha africana TaxID=64632 RepID=UPI002300A15D|nr:ELMO/CED-12 family-domain-containing protein [Mycotypha africana]KAI8977655.1 ELMO/CED-12 family-domain-containing protein [Mycotypha africana]